MLSLPSLRRPVEEVLVLVLILVLYADVPSAQNVELPQSTMNGKQLPWTVPLPVNWGIPTTTMFWDRVVHILLNDKNAENGCVPITTGAIIDSNRILTSFNPFRELSKNASLIDEISILVNTGRNRPNGPTGPPVFTWNIHELWSGRQVTFTPEDEIPSISWHGRGHDRNTPLHDLMVLRVKPDFDAEFAFSSLKEYEYTLAKYAPVKKNIHFYIFKMPIAKPEDQLNYPIRYSQHGLDRESDLQFFEFVREDHALVNCNEYIPKVWGYFICIRNVYNQKGLTSGAILVSGETVFGIGSFAIKRSEDDILVFTDVRPYRDLIMNAMTDDDTN